MDFDDFNYFKWMFIAIGIFTVVGGVQEIYKSHLNTQIELAKINSGKCECK
jgi:hypothetical protein